MEEGRVGRRGRTGEMQNVSRQSRDTHMPVRGRGGAQGLHLIRGWFYDNRGREAFWPETMLN